MFGSSDPDNPMGGLLGDLLKVIGSGPGPGDSWFEAARTLAFGVATDGGQDENPDPLVRIAFEELARVAELHVADATGIASPGGGGVSFEAVGPGQWSFRVLEAYRPVLKSMVDAQQQGAAAVPTSMDLSELDPDDAGGLGGLLGPVRAHARAGLPRHAVRLGRRPPGPPGLRASTRCPCPGPSRRPCCSCRATWPASPRTGACRSRRSSSGSACAS